MGFLPRCNYNKRKITAMCFFPLENYNVVITTIFMKFVPDQTHSSAHLFLSSSSAAAWVLAEEGGG